MKHVRSAVSMIGLLAMMGGCSESAPPPLPDLLPAGSVTGPGVVVGRVTFEGTPPVMRTITEHCFSGQAPITEETVLVSDTGGLANVFVYIDGLPAEEGATRSAKVMDQDECRFIPHVIGVQLNQTLRITTSDPVFHNVHYVSENNGSANFGLPNSGDQRDVTFSRPEIFRVRCDVHPWMNAWIGVFNNPCYAVTGLGGGYRIEGLPPGEHTLVAWHERYGERRMQITVPSSSEAVTADVVYAPPTSE